MDDTDSTAMNRSVYDSDSSFDLKLIPWQFQSYNLGFKHLAKYYIFNHYKFDEFPSRDGTENDVSKLENVLGNLNCVKGAETFQDLRKDEVKVKFDEIAEADYSDCAAVIVVILSHGDKWEIYAKDGKYQFTRLWKIFSSEKSTETLVGKPKIFIIQACQGNKADFGREMVVTDAVPVEKESSSKVTIPASSDFLFLFSSPPGKCAFRDKSGSWMIQTLCQAIEVMHDNFDLQSIFMMVQDHVAREKESYNPYSPKYHEKKQMPFEMSTLTKKFCLTKACQDKYFSDNFSPDELPIRKTNVLAFAGTVAAISALVSIVLAKLLH